LARLHGRSDLQLAAQFTFFPLIHGSRSAGGPVLEWAEGRVGGGSATDPAAPFEIARRRARGLGRLPQACASGTAGLDLFVRTDGAGEPHRAADAVALGDLSL